MLPRRSALVGLALAVVLAVPGAAAAAVAPTAFTNDAQVTGAATATVHGSVNPQGAATTYRVGYDLESSAWCQDDGQSGSPAQTTANQSLAQTDAAFHAVAVNLTGLTPGTNYCAALMAHSAGGDATVSTITFVAGAPLVDLSDLQSTGASTAQITGSVNPSGQATTVHVEYDLGTSTWCQNFGASGSPAHSTAAQNVGATDTASHDVTVNVTGLTPGAAYCARLVAVNGSATTPSDIVTFDQGLPAAGSDDVTITGATTATLSGSVNPTGQATTYHAEYDLATSDWCANPTGAAAHHTAGQNLGQTDLADHPVSVPITGLTAGTEYCAMIVAHNGSGDSKDGYPVSFTAGLPQADTFSVRSTGATTADVLGNVNPAGQATQVRAVYDLDSSDWCQNDGQTGSPAHSTAQQNLGAADTEFHEVTVAVTGLTAGTKYCMAIRATNGSGSATGFPVPFTAGQPQVTTSHADATGATTATVFGQVNPSGQATTVRAEFDEASSAWCQSDGSTGSPAHTTAGQNVAANDSTLHDVTVGLTGLTAGTDYCVRLVAHNASGDAQSFPVPLKAGVPEVDTFDAISTGATTGRVTGAVNPIAQATQVHAAYDTAASAWCTSHGTSGAPAHATADQALAGPVDTSSHDVSVDLTGLTTGTSYCAAIVAHNASGTATGTTVGFTAGMPAVHAFTTQSTGATSVNLLGEVNPAGQAATAKGQFDADASAWCQSDGNSGAPAHETAAQNVAGADSAFHDVTIALGGLTAGTHYCARIVAANAAGTVTSQFVRFIAGQPSADTTGVAATGATTARVHGRVNPAGQATTYRADYDIQGSTWCNSGGETGTAAHHTAEANLGQNDNAFHEVDVDLTGLTAGQNYCAAIVATNPAGSSGGGTIDFTAGLPTVLIDAPTVQSPASEHVSGTVNPNSQATTAKFQSDVASSNWCRSDGQQGAPAHDPAAAPVGADNAVHAVQDTLTGLTPGTSYCVRLVATNAAGTSTSDMVGFVAGAGGGNGAPVVNAQDASGVTASGATLHARVNPAGAATSVVFQWDVASSAFCTAGGAPAHSEPAQNLPADTADHDLSATIGGLASGTAYCFRAVASNAADTTEGPLHQFTTTAAAGGGTNNSGGSTTTTSNAGGGGAGGTGGTTGTGGSGGTSGTSGAGAQSPAGTVTAGKRRVTGGSDGRFALGTATCAAGTCRADVAVTGALAGLRVALAKVPTRSLGRGTISVPAGKGVVLNVKLSKKALAALKKAKTVRATVTVTLTSAGHSTVTKTYTLTLVAPKAKKKKH